MPEQPLLPETPLQRLILEQALALARQLEQAARDAPPGLLLDRCEAAALGAGRAFLRDALAAALQQQVHEGEKKGPRPAPAPADTAAATRGGTHAPS